MLHLIQLAVQMINCVNDKMSQYVNPFRNKDIFNVFIPTVQAMYAIIFHICDMLCYTFLILQIHHPTPSVSQPRTRRRSAATVLAPINNNSLEVIPFPGAAVATSTRATAGRRSRSNAGHNIYHEIHHPVSPTIRPGSSRAHQYMVRIR